VGDFLRRHDMTKEFTAQGWEREVLRSDKPVLVDFWAPWCGPCRRQGPVVDALAEEVGEGALVGKLNVDEHPEVAARYGIRSIPTVAVFRDGKPVKGFVGMTDIPALKEALVGAGARI
jgi:thioredoxin 1